MMEFQQGMILVVAFIGTISGAGAFYGMTKSELNSLRNNYVDLKDRVVYKDACSACKENAQNQISSLKEDISNINRKLDLILETLVNGGGSWNGSV